MAAIAATRTATGAKATSRPPRHRRPAMQHLPTAAVAAASAPKARRNRRSPISVSAGRGRRATIAKEIVKASDSGDRAGGHPVTSGPATASRATRRVTSPERMHGRVPSAARSSRIPIRPSPSLRP